jgi:hypothetical protein
MAGGKWRHMMAMEMKKGEWPGMRITPPVIPAQLSKMELPVEARLGVAIEGRLEPIQEDEREATHAQRVHARHALF